jgi:hypothetical protein
MRRILLICASAAVLALPAAAAAGARGHAAPGYLVVRKAAGDGGIYGNPVVTVVVQGFVLGRVSPKAQARVAIYHLPGAAPPQAKGLDVAHRQVRWRGHAGVEYSGNGFRFSAIGGWYRVVVRGSRVYLFAGGHGRVWLHGSSFDKRGDGTYALDGGAPRSLPTRLLKLPLGRD